MNKLLKILLAIGGGVDVLFTFFTPILICLLYGAIGLGIYFIISKLNKTFDPIFGELIKRKIKKK